MDDAKPKPDETAKTETPGSDPHTNRPGVTNGVPDGLSDGGATALPDSDRLNAETAGGGTGAGG